MAVVTKRGGAIEAAYLGVRWRHGETAILSWAGPGMLFAPGFQQLREMDWSRQDSAWPPGMAAGLFVSLMHSSTANCRDGRLYVGARQRGVELVQVWVRVAVWRYTLLLPSGKAL